jgi:hypothetical protein
MQSMLPNSQINMLTDLPENQELKEVAELINRLVILCGLLIALKNKCDLSLKPTPTRRLLSERTLSALYSLRLHLQKILPTLKEQQGFGTALKYLVVPEFQKRGAVHYHIIFFKFPKQEDTNELLNSVWGHGFTFNKTINSVDHLKNYVTKYFVKNALDPRLKGKKHYFCSRNLGRPVLLREQTNNEAIISVLKDPEYQNSYSSNGEEITYSIFQNSPLIPYIYFKKEKAKPQLPPKQTEINFNEHHTRQSRRNTKTK